MIDYASEIKDRITMGDVLSTYGLTTKDHGRIPCPLHNGHDANFSFRDRGYKCFVCGAHGSVLDFVMAYFGLPFTEAVKKLNDDFRLGLPIGGETISRDKRIAIEKAQSERRKKRLCKQLDRAIWNMRYETALTDYVRHEKTAQKCEPQTPFDTAGIEYRNARFGMAEAKYRMEEAQEWLYKIEHSDK